MVPARFCPIDEIKFRHFDWRTKKRYQGWAAKEIWIGELKLKDPKQHFYKYGWRLKTRRVHHRCVRALNLFPFHWNVLVCGIHDIGVPLIECRFTHCTKISNCTKEYSCRALTIPERVQKGRLALRGVLKTTIGLCPSSKSRNLYRKLGQTWQFISIAIIIFTVSR